MVKLKTLLTRLDRVRSYQVLDRPIFILSAPRSGSTFLFDLLSQFENVWAWHAEVDDIWWTHFPYERLADPSDHVGGEEYTPRAGRQLRRDFYRYALWAREERGVKCSWKERVGAIRVRYLDKTIANCFHLGFLKAAFPDALYLFLLRDGRATVSSMMEGWGEPERFAKMQLQKLVDQANGPLRHWAFPAPPGWRNVLDRSLEEACAWSWCRHVQTAARELADVPAPRQMTLKYEDLVAAPAEVARRVGEFCQLTWRPEVAAFAEKRPLSRTTVSAPEATKWRRLHGPQIERVLPVIAPVMAGFGYGIPR